MDIRKKAVATTTVLHLRDANDELMYSEKEDGSLDKDKPVEVVLHTPASKQFRAADAEKHRRFMDRVKRKGKDSTSASQQIEERAEFLAAVTVEFRNLEYGDITEPTHKAKAVYGDITIGFIADQVDKHLGDWANFSGGAQKT